jgi:hypothetical protein
MGFRSKVSAVAAVATALALPASAAANMTINVGTASDPDPIVGCSLRAAVISADLNMDNYGCPGPAVSYGDDTIVLAANTIYNLTKGGAPGEATAQSGDLDISSAVTNGKLTITSPGGAVIDASTLPAGMNDRVIDVLTAGDLTLAGVSIRGGDDQDTDEHGGGIRSLGTFAMSNGDISGNTADDGGGLYGDGPSATLGNVTISGNTSSGHGAGVWKGAGGTSVELFNSTLTANTGSSAAWAQGGDVDITNSIVSGNSSSDCGGGVESHGNSALGVNCGGAPGPGDLPISADLKLGPLTDNGGHTLTHALLPGSPALDKGAACLPTDQRGTARPQGTACDIGAFELAVSPPIVCGTCTPPPRRCPKGKKLKTVKKHGKKKKKCVKKKKRHKKH